MSKFRILFFLVFVGFNFVEAQFPDYVQKCSKSDPNLQKCIMDQSANVIEHLVKGDKEKKIPPLDPFHISKIVIEATRTLNIKLTGCEISGLKDTTFTNLRVDLKNLNADLTLFIPKITIKTSYDIDGQILILPIKGHGPAEITLSNTTFEFKFKWTLKKMKDGKDYVDVITPDLKYNIGIATYHFGNLFNGDKKLGEEMNAFINENWVEFSESIQPAISRTINDVVFGIISGFSKSVPYESIFNP